MPKDWQSVEIWQGNQVSWVLLIGVEVEFWKNVLDVHSESEDHACEERKIWGREAPSGKFRITYCAVNHFSAQQGNREL